MTARKRDDSKPAAAPAEQVAAVGPSVLSGVTEPVGPAPTGTTGPSVLVARTTKAVTSDAASGKGKP